MNNQVKECEKCGSQMKQSGQGARLKPEGESEYDGSLKMFYWCMTEGCENQYKSI